MLNPRSGEILKSIVVQYIARAVPVSSQSIVNESNLNVSSATVRSEVARLEEENYIIRPHTSAGSVPADKGYRYYVGTLKDVQLPSSERLLISHLFHQVERELEEWLVLAARLIAHSVEDMAIVTLPKPPASRLKHLELVSLHDYLALLVLILRGARARQQLLSFDRPVAQSELTATASGLNAAYSGLSAGAIESRKPALPALDKQVTESVIGIMRGEDRREYEEPLFDGLHFVLRQPEFAQSQRLLSLTELVEHRDLLRHIVPEGTGEPGVNVVIGREHRAEALQDYSVVISRYGIPEEAEGNIGVVGPTRMPYDRAIAIVDYLASVLSRLVAELYGRPRPETAS